MGKHMDERGTQQIVTVVSPVFALFLSPFLVSLHSVSVSVSVFALSLFLCFVFFWSRRWALVGGPQHLYAPQPPLQPLPPHSPRQPPPSANTLPTHSPRQPPVNTLATPTDNGNPSKSPAPPGQRNPSANTPPRPHSVTHSPPQLATTIPRKMSSTPLAQRNHAANTFHTPTGPLCQHIPHTTNGNPSANTFSTPTAWEWERDCQHTCHPNRQRQSPPHLDNETPNTSPHKSALHLEKERNPARHPPTPTGARYQHTRHPHPLTGSRGPDPDPKMTFQLWTRGADQSKAGIVKSPLAQSKAFLFLTLPEKSMIPLKTRMWTFEL